MGPEFLFPFANYSILNSISTQFLLYDLTTPTAFGEVITLISL